ncbi:reverse transcriptase domain-containing protein [Tanacetum coccineum]
MKPIIEYLKEGTLPDDRLEASKLCIKAMQYELLEGILYRWSFLKLWLRTTVRGSQSYAAGILLANHAPGRTRNDTHMQRLSNTSSRAKKPPTAANPNHGPVAVLQDNIVCRFSLPGEIVSDNGKQFSDNPFKDWRDKLNITQRFTLVKHPQSNGLVERANRSLGEGIKARLGEGNKNWIEELPHVLWAHRTMIKSRNGDTPFSSTYGTEAVIPVEIGIPTVRSVTFKPGDFVYRSNDASHAVGGGKLGPKWEGPYEVTEALGYGAYKLRSTDGTKHVEHR